MKINFNVKIEVGGNIKVQRLNDPNQGDINTIYNLDGLSLDLNISEDIEPITSTEYINAVKEVIIESVKTIKNQIIGKVEY